MCMIEKAFREIGVRAVVTMVPQPGFSQRKFKRRHRGRGQSKQSFTPWSWEDLLRPIRIDVKHDEFGEYFDVKHRAEVDLNVPEFLRQDRHLLLVADTSGRRRARQQEAFLCGHDERAWFVAAIPESANAGSVQAAKDALKPPEVWESIRVWNVPMERRDRRRTAAFVRQGEWFFIPRHGMYVYDHQVLHNEPIQRGAGKPHMCEILYRMDGETVYVNDQHPNGLTIDEFNALPAKEANAPTWRRMVRGARVYVRGKVRHPDHATIWLGVWHEVVMNTETQARAMQHVAFLD